MTDTVSISTASEGLLPCAVFLAEGIKSGESRAAAFQPIIERYLAREDVDSAAQYADTIGDPFLRDRMLIAVIARCIQLEDDDYGMQLVDAIEEDRARSTGREVIAIQMAARGDFDSAIGVADELEHSSDALAALAAMMAKHGEDQKALEMIERIDFFSARVGALVEMAAFELGEGNLEKAVGLLDDAVSSADWIEFAEDRIRGLVEIAAGYTAAEKGEKAITTLGKAQTHAEELDGAHKDGVFASLSTAFLRAGSVELADRALDQVSDKTQMANALAVFSGIYLDESDEDEALETAEEAHAIWKSEQEREVRNSKERYRVLGVIATQFGKLGKFERAMEIVHENPDGGVRKQALMNIAQIYVLKGRTDEAEQARTNLETELDRVECLMAMSDAADSANDRETALALLGDAVEESESIPQMIGRFDLMLEAAKRFHHYGEEARARDLASVCLETVLEILGDVNRAIALCSLSEFFDQHDLELSEAEKEVLVSIVRKSVV